MSSSFTITAIHLNINVMVRGLAVASRLSEDPSVTVAVVEAGPNAEHLPEVFDWIKTSSSLTYFSTKRCSFRDWSEWESLLPLWIGSI